MTSEQWIVVIVIVCVIATLVGAWVSWRGVK